LTILKEKAEDVDRGTDNTRVIRKDKRQAMIYKTLQKLHKKLKIAQYEPHKKRVVNLGAPKGKQFLLHQ
jgi:hypothetical protein